MDCCASLVPFFGLAQDGLAPRTIEKPGNVPVSRSFHLHDDLSRYTWCTALYQGPVYVTFPTLPSGIHAALFPNPYPSGDFRPWTYPTITLTLDPGVPEGPLLIPMQFEAVGRTFTGMLHLAVSEQPTLEAESLGALSLVPGGFGLPLDILVVSTGTAVGDVMIKLESLPEGVTAREEAAPHPLLRRIRLTAGANATPRFQWIPIPTTVSQGTLSSTSNSLLFMGSPGAAISASVDPQLMVLGAGGGTADCFITVLRMGTSEVPVFVIESIPSGTAAHVSTIQQDVMHFVLQVPSDLPPGLYPIRLSMFLPSGKASHSLSLYFAKEP